MRGWPLAIRTVLRVRPCLLQNRVKDILFTVEVIDQWSTGKILASMLSGSSSGHVETSHASFLDKKPNWNQSPYM